MIPNVGPGYTNIARMGVYVTLVAGERFAVEDFFGYGKERLRLSYDGTMERGSFSEDNSPTYTRVLIEALNHFTGRHLARRFHPPTGQLPVSFSNKTQFEEYRGRIRRQIRAQCSVQLPRSGAPGCIRLDRRGETMANRR